jgi:hypothetical protein
MNTEIVPTPEPVQQILQWIIAGQSEDDSRRICT